MSHIAVLIKYIKILNDANLEPNNRTIFLSEIVGVIEKETKILNREKLIEGLSLKLENKIVNDLKKKKVEILEILDKENIFLKKSKVFFACDFNLV